MIRLSAILRGAASLLDLSAAPPRKMETSVEHPRPWLETDGDAFARDWAALAEDSVTVFRREWEWPISLDEPESSKEGGSEG